MDHSQIIRVFKNIILNAAHSIEEDNQTEGAITFKSAFMENFLYISIIALIVLAGIIFIFKT